MDRLIDLHTHSTCSDGSMTPRELVAHAKASGMAAIALSDHDGVDGVHEAVAEGERLGVEVVPAIELSAQSATETHILGYFIDPDAPAMVLAMKRIREVREERSRENCRKLCELGFPVTMEETREIAGGEIVCRAHFARLLVNKGLVGSVKEAFDKYLANGRPAYSGLQALTDEEAIDLIHKAGGIAFLAHLHLIRLSDEDLFAFLERLKAAGLDGIEGYYTEYTQEMQEKFRGMARALSLEISGGTDFHAAMKPHIAIGRGTGGLEIPYSVLERLKIYYKNKKEGMNK
ncbi:MAG: PHP domain-containing protein [Clostridia bacterium]|nr:PHP domain-containing protein [Clostridia bacterium]